MPHTERQVSMGCIASIVAWLITFAFILSGTVVAIAGGPDGRSITIALGLLAHGLAISAGAATVTIRAMLRSHMRLMHDAFELGRDTSPSVRAFR